MAQHGEWWHEAQTKAGYEQSVKGCLFPLEELNSMPTSDVVKGFRVEGLGFKVVLG